MKKTKMALGLTEAIVWSSTLAGTMGAMLPDTAWKWVGSFSVGPAWENGGATQTFYLTPEIEKSYRANKTTQTLGDFEVFFGGQQTLSSMLLGQLGLAVGATTDVTLSGIIWDDAEPAFNNFSYRYKVQHTHIATKGKLLADRGYWVIPWVSMSIGVGFNNASNFHNTPLIEEALATPNFKSHTETTFTYTIGAGIQKALNTHWQVGAGYEFADWGKNHLNRAAGQTMNHGLRLNHLYTNGLMFNLSFVA